MTFPNEDLDRIEKDYTRGDDATSLDDFRDDLRGADFDPDSADAAAAALAAQNDVAVSQRALQQAQREAVDSLSDAGAVGGEIVRAEDGFTPIGKPQNVEQRIERTGPNTGAVIAENQNTGTSGKIGEVDLANPAEVID